MVPELRRKSIASINQGVVASYDIRDVRRSATGLLGSTALALVLQAAGSVLRYLSQIIMARWLRPAEFGSYSYASTAAQVLASMGVLGLGSGALRLIPEYMVARRWALLRGLLCGSAALTVAASGALALVSAVVVFFCSSSLDHTALLVGVLLIPAIALSNLESESLRGFRRIGMALLGPFILQPIVETVLSLLIVKGSGSLNSPAAVGARLVAITTVVLFEIWCLWAVVPEAVSDVKREYATREWVEACFPFLRLSFYMIVLARADVLVLGLLRDAYEVGIYGAAMTTAALVGVVLMAANAKGAPLMAELYARGDMAGLEQVARTITRFSVVSSLLVASMLIIFRGPILELFGKGFAEGGLVLIILVAGQLFNACTGPVYYLLTMTAHEKDSARIIGRAALADVILCVLLVPDFGMVGAALSSAGTIFLWNVWHYFVVRKRLGIDTLGILPIYDEPGATSS